MMVLNGVSMVKVYFIGCWRNETTIWS
jgi:hypothetical protein